MRWLILALAALGFGALIVLPAMSILRAGDLPPAAAGRPAPAFDLPGLAPGRPGLATADLRGKVGLVNVFASWCLPCRAEHPLLMDLAAAGTVALYGIAYRDQPADTLAWLDRLGDPFARIGADRDGSAGAAWGIHGVPESFVIDREGRIRYRHTGPLTVQTLDRVLRPLLAALARQ